MQYPTRTGPVVNDQAVFTPSMTQGYQPDRNRERLPLRVGWFTREPQVLPFGIEMVFGSKPDRPRLFTAPRIPLPISQTTQTSAPFSPEMTAGWMPSFDVRSAPYSTGGVFSPPDVLFFSIEMVQGSGPSFPRLFLGQRAGVQISQPTHVQAPFSPEMSEGYGPTVPVLFRMPKVGWSIAQTSFDQAAFSPEMVAGSHPDSGRAWLPLRTGLQIWNPSIDAFSIEMVQGWHPDSPRIVLGPRIGQPISQPTHVNAPFSVEMTQGYQARSGIWIIHPAIGGSDAVATFVPGPPSAGRKLILVDGRLAIQLSGIVYTWLD